MKLVRITTIPISLEKLLENQLLFMKEYYNLTAISSDKVNLERLGKQQEIPVFHVEMTRKITPWQDLKAVWKLFWYFKKERPFIVHTHTPKAGILGMIASKLAGVPNRLHTVAGLPLLETSGNRRRLLDAVEKITYTCATKIYPNSKGLYSIILENKYTNLKKLKVLANGSSNGIDTGYFDPKLYFPAEIDELKRALHISHDDLVFIFVGRLVGDKGINELIRAFQKISSVTNKIKLLLVGLAEADLDPLAQETLYEIDNNYNIISVGFQKDIRRYLALSHCLVFPSYREGFPNVVMQAGAMELPCIVSDINGCNEIIEHGKNGLIIPVKDEVALFDAMKIIIEQSETRFSLKSNAREMIVSRYDQLVVWRALLIEYQSFARQS